MRVSSLNKYALWTVFFLTFLGYYVFLLLGFKAGMAEVTRKFTIPIRAVIGVGCMSLFLTHFKNKVPYLRWFLLFVIIYLFKILFAYLNVEPYYMSYTELFFYFLSFCIIPFIALSKVDFWKLDIHKLYIVFLISAILFGSLASMNYARFIGQVARLSTGLVGEDVISPLHLSYCASLAIGVSSMYLLTNKTTPIIKLVSLLVILVSIIPFFLGASRGSIFALFLPFILLVYSDFSIKNFFRYAILFTLLIVALVYLANYLHSGLLNRFLRIGTDIEMEGSSASRVVIWKGSISQFMEHPIFGDKLAARSSSDYPHNIIIEVLQQVGIVGFIPFMALLYMGLKASIKIFKDNLSYCWLTVLYLQALMQYMFSGSVFSAAWFWTSLAIVLAFDYSFQRKQNSQLIK